MILTADFETITTEPTRVWAYGLCEVGNPFNFIYGNNIDDFMRYCQGYENHTLYFHNLAFDGTFILTWLFENGYEFVTDRKELGTKTFTTLISDTGLFYSMEIVFKKQGKKTNKVSILDSMKLLPMSVENVAKSFGLPISKLKIDYETEREIGHILTKEEVDYLRNDVAIMSMALKTMFEQGLSKMTIGSNALSNYKESVGLTHFESWFPVPDYDEDIRRSYKGGFTYLKPWLSEKDLGNGLVFDVNSLYPSVMYDCPLPYDHGIHYNGEYKVDKHYNLYVQTFICNFELKEGFIPTIQIRGGRFADNEYLTSSDGEDVCLCLTSVDLKLFLEHYDVYNIEYIGGWKFKSSKNMFKKYIDYWVGIKIQADKDGNKGMRQLAKLMLNSLYGKFATNPIAQSKIPYYEDGKVKFRLGEKEYRKPLYIPMGCFITAHARYKTISSAQAMYNNFAYADTDSLHLFCLENESIDELLEKSKQFLDVHPTNLGAWKHESTYRKARFLRQKTYIEDEIITKKEYEKAIEEFKEEIEIGTLKYYKENDNYYRIKITCAGMPDKCYQFVSWDNFHIGTSYAGKLQKKTVVGGTILNKSDFKIRERKRV